MQQKGLRVKLAYNDKDVLAGFIQYLPVEQSILEGKDCYIIYCIWVHGHKKGRGNLMGKGLGTALLEAAEQDVKALGAKGIAAWCLTLPFWMKAAWFKKHGYKKVDADGIAALMWKPFSDDAIPPQWRKPIKKPTAGTEKVIIRAFNHGWCAAQNIAFERMKKIAAEFHDQVVYEEYNTRDRAIMEEWGLSDALFIDADAVNTGPPPSYDKLKKLVEKKLKKRKLL
ncbi:MAG: GNAT family N-acetyltransferase [Candidatus Cloacimonadaceae bacterium]|nr:GNAT family N-acetyltransferase [Candidatus Cloacimonadaceae bacterium]